MRRFITAIVSIALSAAAAAHGPMTLADCLGYARQHAPANVVGRLDSERARIDTRLEMARMLPSVSLSTSGNLSFGRNIDPETNTYDNKKTLSQGFGLYMSLPLFDGLVNINNLKAAKAARRATGAAGRRRADEIALATVAAFYNVSYCRAMVRQMEEQLERDRHTLAATERGVSLGTKSGADRAEILAIVAADEYELTNQRSLLDKAYLNLRATIGMEPSAEPLDIVETDTVAAPLDADAPFVHPRVAEAEASVSEGRYLLRAARGAFAPSVSLSAGVSTSYYRMIGSEAGAPDFSRQWRDNMGQYLGLSISLPIFDGLMRVNRVKRASVELQRRRALLDEARYNTDRERAEAQIDLTNARKEHEAARARVAAEEKAFAAISRKYELGSVSAIDLYTASTKLATARATLEGKRIQVMINTITVGYLDHGFKY